MMSGWLSKQEAEPDLTIQLSDCADYVIRTDSIELVYFEEIQQQFQGKPLFFSVVWPSGMHVLLKKATLLESPTQPLGCLFKYQLTLEK